MIIRDFNISDYENVIDLWQKSRLPFKPNGRDSKQSLKKEINKPSSIFLLIEKEEEIIGSVFGTHDGRKGWINRLAIRPDFQNQGLGSMLLTKLLNRFSKMGIKIIAALIEDWNDTSINFFKKNNFQVHKDIYYLTHRESPDV
jgi:ribosomal protein S18 acetylase RimI-like enzyme